MGRKGASGHSLHFAFRPPPTTFDQASTSSFIILPSINILINFRSGGGPLNKPSQTLLSCVYPTVDAPHKLTSHNPSASPNHISLSLSSKAHSSPITRDVEAMADDEIPVNPSFPPSNDLGPSSSGSEPSSVAKQRQGGKGVYDDYDLENSSKNPYQISNPGRTKLYPVSHLLIST